MNMQVLEARRDVSGGYKVDVTRGQRVGRVSSEWFSRPDDERYLSLSELAHTVRERSERSRTRVVESELIHVEGITLVGGMPPGVEITTIFSAGVPVAVAPGSPQATLVRALLDFMTSPEAEAAKRRQGMEPA